MTGVTAFVIYRVRYIITRYRSSRSASMRSSRKSVSRQTPSSWAIRSRRPTILNPARSCSARLAVFSGKMLVWIVQIPAAAPASTRARMSWVPTPRPRADDAT